MWFVLASETPSRLDAVTTEIEAQTGLRVLGLPKLKEYFIGLKVTPPPETGLPETPLPERAPCGTDASPPDAANRALILALQAGLPIVPRPFEAAARMTGLTVADTIARLAALSERGAIRRIAAVPNHYALGWTENAMTVWDVDEAAIDAIGAAIGHQPFVSHCYRRPRFAPEWPYSLFAMVHGRTRAEVEAKIAALAALCGPALRASDRLYSTRILKKTGLRITG
jgi:DNA-binding Lrp family transcriptional regulator